MGSETYYIKPSVFVECLKRLYREPCFGTVSANEHCTYEKLSPETLDKVTLSALGPTESVKDFLFPARERVAVYPRSGPTGESRGAEVKPAMVIGARGCDLRALEMLDKIFLDQDVKDSFYEKRRNNITIISTDCLAGKKSCFCNLLGAKPFAEKGFDLNISVLSEGYLLTCGSEKGQNMIEQIKELLAEPAQEQLDERNQRRDGVLKQLDESNKRFGPVNDSIKAVDRLSAERWVELCSTCVECGGCNFVCPTCHCFLLYDQPIRGSSGQNERQKSWDSCMLANYAKMAGVGGMKPTPRPELRSRFENRVRHKFQWLPESIGLLGCVGCGRCYDACLSDLDIRDVFEETG